MHGLGEARALLLCIGGAAASEKGESVSQQRSLLPHWFTLCTMMFMFKFTCVVLWQMSTMLFFSLAMIVRAICKCLGCICCCVRTICCKPVLILFGFCMFCFAYSLHVTGCLDPCALGCGLFQLLVNCYLFIEVTMKTLLCTNHPMICGALATASAGHLASALLNFMGKPEKYRRCIISCRTIKAKRYGQSPRTVWRLKCKQQQFDFVEPVRPCVSKPLDFTTHSDLKGGSGGGSSATRRKRSERDLLQGLQTLLERFADADPEPEESNANQSLISALTDLIHHAERNPETPLNDLKKLVLSFTKKQQQQDVSTVKSHDSANTNSKSWAEIAATRPAKPATHAQAKAAKPCQTQNAEQCQPACETLG